MTKRRHHKLGIAFAFVGVGFMLAVAAWCVSTRDVSSTLICLGAAGMQVSLGLGHMDSYEDVVRREEQS